MLRKKHVNVHVFKSGNFKNENVSFKRKFVLHKNAEVLSFDMIPGSLNLGQERLSYFKFKF